MSSPNCPSMMDNDCTCSSSLMKVNNEPGFEIICQKGDEEAYYHLEINPNSIELECGSQIPYKENMYQYYDVNSTENYVFQSCPLPNITISSLLNNTEITSLSFTCGECENNDVINPDIFANQTNLKSLTISRFNFTRIPKNLFSILTNLASIGLDFNQIEIIPENLFENLNNLENLSLGTNNLVAIPVTLFKNLTKLKILYLNNNKLTYIAKDTFRDLISLERLNVKDNGLNKLDPFTFVKNINLKEINMGGNLFVELEAFSFANISNIDRIDLSSNKMLIKLHEDIFGSLLPNLTDLSFSNCNVTSLPETIFNGLPSLSKLYLSFNGFSTLPENLFSKNEELMHLDLSENKLSSLPKQIFTRKFNLQTLNVGKNNFKIIPKETFIDLSKLKTLNMDVNYLEKISKGDFDDLIELEILNLSFNFISSLPAYQTFGIGLKGLREINLSHNNLTELVPVNWGIYTSLSVLDLSYNQIKTFSIPRLSSKDTELNLMHNEISYVNCQELKDLDDALKDTNDDESSSDLKNYFTSIFRLNSNPFRCDCNLLKFRNFIECPVNSYRKKLFPDLSLYQCNEPSNLKNLTLISVPVNLYVCQVITDCPIDCDCYLRGNDNVTVVNCSKTKRTTLPLTLPFNSTVLDLKDNYLTTLNGMNDNSWNIIRELYLDNNYLISLDYKLPHSLKKLTVTGNYLTLIPQTLSTFAITNGVKLYLGNNPWSCNCSGKTLRNLLSFSYESVGDFLNITCYLPMSLRGKTMENITEDGMCPTGSSIQISYIILAVIVGFIVILAFVLCILYYRNKRTIVAYLYIHYFKIYSIFFKEDFDEDKYYHAFVSYSSADRDIALELVEELENKEPKFKLCIHERDWQPGNLITFNIVHSVQNSRRTILVLSEHFIKSIWFQLEFHIAYYQMLEDKIDRLIIIVKGELPNKDSLDNDLQILLTTKTYLQWGEKWFWEKLKYALPHRENIAISRELYPQNPSNALVRKIEDKIMSFATQSAQPANKTITQIENNNENLNDIHLNEINDNFSRNFGIEILNYGNNNKRAKQGITPFEPKFVTNESRI